MKLRRRRRQPQAQQAGGTAVDTQAVASKSAPILDPGVPLPQDVQEYPKNPINSPRNADVETGLPDGVCKGETGQCGHGDDMKVPSARNRSCSSESESGTPGWLREHRRKKAEGRLRTFAGDKRPLEVARTGQDPQNQNGGTARPVSGTPPRNKLAREAFGRLRSAAGEYQRVPEHPRARGSSGLKAKSAPSRPTQYASPPLRPRNQDSEFRLGAIVCLCSISLMQSDLQGYGLNVCAGRTLSRAGLLHFGRVEYSQASQCWGQQGWQPVLGSFDVRCKVLQATGPGIAFLSAARSGSFCTDRAAKKRVWQ